MMLCKVYPITSLIIQLLFFFFLFFMSELHTITSKNPWLVVMWWYDYAPRLCWYISRKLPLACNEYTLKIEGYNQTSMLIRFIIIMRSFFEKIPEITKLSIVLNVKSKYDHVFELFAYILVNSINRRINWRTCLQIPSRYKLCYIFQCFLNRVCDTRSLFSWLSI